MNIKKVAKKIAALTIGATFVGATILGAVAAADLGAYPEPFITDHTWAGKIVVGANAATKDVMGAMDVAASLQALSYVETDVDTSGVTTLDVEGGELIQKGSSDLNYGEEINDIVDSFDEEDFDGLLEDGILEDDSGDSSGSEYDFTQVINLGDQTVTFENPDSDLYEIPLFTLDLDGAAQSILEFVIDFDDADVSFIDLDDNEEITMFGKKFTFATGQALGDEVLLYGTEESVYVENGETVTVESDGDEYDITVLGGNADANTAIVRVSGDSETVEEGDSTTIGGLDLYISNVFITNIGEDDVSVELFVGSDEFTLPAAGGGAATLEVDGQDVDGVTVTLAGTNAAVTSMTFAIDPTQVENVELDDDYDWLAIGDVFVDPLFGFEVYFEGVMPELESDSDGFIEFKKSGDDIVMEFSDNSGNTLSLPIFTEDADNDDIDFHEDLATDDTDGSLTISVGGEILDGEIFFLVEDAAKGDPKTKVYEVKSIDDSDDEVELKELLSGRTVTVGEGDEIQNTGVEIVTIEADDDGFTLDTATQTVIWTKYDARITLPDLSGTTDDTAVLLIDEDENGAYTEDVPGADYDITIDGDGTNDEIDITILEATLTKVTGEDDNEYAISDYGTYFVREDDDDDWVKIYVPERDRYFNVIVSPGAATVTSGTSGGTTTKEPVAITNIGVLDTEVEVDSGNLLVIGGPCANSIAYELMGNDVCGEGFTQGKGLIKMWETGDYMALLVAGYEADDTLAAVDVIVNYDDYATEFDGKSEVEVTTATKTVTEITPIVPDVPDTGNETI